MTASSSASAPDSTLLADRSQACYTASVLGCKDVYSELQIRTAYSEISGTGIYALRNTVTGKVYVGSAVNLPQRCCQHVWALRKNRHKNYLLQNAWKKYGEGNFIFEVLEKVEPKNLLSREQHWIDTHRAAGEGYNLNPTAGSNLGRTFSETARKNIADAARKAMADPEVKARHREATRAAMADPEVRRKMSEAAKRRQADPEGRAAFMAATTAQSVKEKRNTSFQKTFLEESLEVKQARKERNYKSACKRRYEVIYPEGEYAIIDNLTGFCRDNALELHKVRRRLDNNTGHIIEDALKGFRFRRLL